MKKIVLLLLGLFFLSGCASAYTVMIDAPDTLPVGKPLVVTGNTTYGIGTPLDVALFFQLTTSTQVQRKVAYIQSDKTFRTVFDTTGLTKGTYKVEVPINGGSDSSTMRSVQLVDRSDEIELGSSTIQNMNGKLYIAGTISSDKNSGIQIEAFSPDGSIVFGPKYINTNLRGDFSTDVPIPTPGDYVVSFTDAHGYIGDRTITVLGESGLIETTPSVTTTLVVLSAHTTAAQDHPAYFAVRTGSDPVTVYTSTSIDWIIEYFDASGLIQVVNLNGQQTPERIEIPGNGKIVYVKMYPARMSETGTAFLYARNARSVSVCPTVPEIFAGRVLQTTTPTLPSPELPFLGFLATCAGLFLVRRIG
ncbi:MAG: hypothetical protein METHP_01913 [Methanoregula sp. SKADARSKE-2]|nr:MAG: hypothetical protein METHP_01913 [Methanoregula sp. SKADARSKE-2]